MLSNRLLTGEWLHCAESLVGLESLDLYALDETHLQPLSHWPGILYQHSEQTTCIIADSRLLFLRPWLLWMGYTQVNFATTDAEQLDIFLHRLRNRNHFTQSHDVVQQEVADSMHRFLREAVHQDVSDIHLELQREQCCVRMRIDGLLHTIATLPHSWHAPMLSYCKLLANVDIGEQRLPQDGRFTFHIGQEKRDCRLNTIPTMHGEKCVIRLLPQLEQLAALDQLGLLPTQLQCLQKTMALPQGLILITGPTGSGKTMTLYVILQALNQTHRNIATIEDPIEITLPGLNQMQVNLQSGLTFAKALRALLRQDPDIIMVGEIRDEETASIAIRAAQTGHLVLATLHANSTDNAISRLQDMGVSAAHLQEALSLTIAQRLARRLCTHCHGSECSRCHQGYRGRVGLYAMSPDEHNTTLRTAADHWVAQGITTIDECQRVMTC